ncbi:COG1470 family protein [Streptomyces sp. NPDC002514]|uniref:COG1470 family protein n=1 Tax=Streptomyces sp. NPDC001270 TaxID=3364554 RepID=UPI00368477DD
MSVSANLDESSVTVEPGGEADLAVQVLNSGTIVEECRFEVVGPCADWATVEPASLSLYPGATGSATVTLRPPRTSQVVPGETPLGLRVVPTSDGAETAVLERSVTVLPFTEITSELVPPGSSGAWRGRHKLAVDSRGNTPVTIALSARGATERSRLALDPAEVEIPPGQAKFAVLSVRPAKRLWRGTPITHPFQVAVTPRAREGQDPYQPVLLDGSYEQQAILPRWLPRALVVAVLLAAALVGLWYSVLRPTVRSAAREAVTPQVVESAARQGNAGPNGGGDNGQGQEASGGGGQAGSAGSGGASASPGGSTTAAPGVPGGSEPGGAAVPSSARVQVRDAVGGSATRRTAYAVPDGSTFELTDIVVQNPQGDAGTLVISTDDGQLLNLALENFRDSDYHFVTPVEVQSGGRITIAVSCREVGKPVKAPAPSQCSESLFLGGKISTKAQAGG